MVAKRTGEPGLLKQASPDGRRNERAAQQDKQEQRSRSRCLGAATARGRRTRGRWRCRGRGWMSGGEDQDRSRPETDKRKVGEAEVATRTAPPWGPGCLRLRPVEALHHSPWAMDQGHPMPNKQFPIVAAWVASACGAVGMLASICLPGRGPSAPIAGHRTSWAMPGHPCPSSARMFPGRSRSRAGCCAGGSPLPSSGRSQCSVLPWDWESRQDCHLVSQAIPESVKRGRHGWMLVAHLDAGSTSRRP